MRTVVIEKIEDKKIIKVFRRPTVNPVQTQKRAAAAMEDEPLMAERKILLEKKNDILKRLSKKTSALILLGRAGKENSPQFVKLNGEVADLRKQANALAGEITELIPKIEKRYVELKHENLTYFQPYHVEEHLDEEIIKESEYQELMGVYGDLGKNKVMTRDGKILDDYRGLRYWSKVGEDWNRGMITVLGKVPPENHKKDSELTDEDVSEIRIQLEKERIFNLSDEQRQSEEAGEMERLLSMASAKMHFEAKGDPEKEKEIEEWYETEKTKLTNKYSV